MYAARAMQLTREALGLDFEDRYLQTLKEAPATYLSSRTEQKSTACSLSKRWWIFHESGHKALCRSCLMIKKPTRTRKSRNSNRVSPSLIHTLKIGRLANSV